ncbi:hypothetical protein EVAR_76180_1 [Eumeta japonica]|uniref:Uncharacterized protein n=1 Tax=Eumeta variegata TaxID=151549 RepID=A0A4C1UXA3_EUMVA|nr:hypothetical protein EVAR_76180_1 [Eumeta japonica]
MRLRLRRKPVGRAAAPPARPRGVQVSVYISVDRNVSRETHAADRPSVYLAYPFITTLTSVLPRHGNAVDTRRPHGERGKHPRLYKQGHPKGASSSSAAGKRQEEGSSPPQGRSSVQHNNDDGVSFRTLSSGGINVLHRIRYTRLMEIYRSTTTTRNIGKATGDSGRQASSKERVAVACRHLRQKVPALQAHMRWINNFRRIDSER